jgi:hypothetical protein
MKDITKMQDDAQNRHQAVLDMIEALSDTPSSEGASSVWQFQSSLKIKHDFCSDKHGLFRGSQQVSVIDY